MLKNEAVEDRFEGLIKAMEEQTDMRIVGCVTAFFVADENGSDLPLKLSIVVDHGDQRVFDYPKNSVRILHSISQWMLDKQQDDIVGNDYF